MDRMTSRERVVTTLNHQEPDRVPFDCPLGYQAYTRLRDLLGFIETKKILPSGPDLSIHPSIEFLREMKADLIYVGLGSGRDEPPFELGIDTYTDEWGIQYSRLDGLYGISYEVTNHPLANATVDDLNHYAWPDPNDLTRVEGLRDKCEAIYKNTDFAIVGRFNTSIFEQAFGLRGLEQFLIDMVVNRDFACALLDKTTDIAIGMLDAGMRACGEYIQILRLAGDDMGHQSGTILSPRTFRSIIKSRFARLYTYARKLFLEINPYVKMMAHTDGDVYSLIPDYIEMGLDALNPVQPGVTHMDHKILKKEFGNKLSFHAGIDIQHLLPHGTPEEVKAETKRTIRTLGPGGGYIVAPTHYLLPDIPPENVLALRDAVMEFGNYPLDEQD
jgi:uroporphyrinogen decarboxylase